MLFRTPGAPHRRCIGDLGKRIGHSRTSSRQSRNSYSRSFAQTAQRGGTHQCTCSFPSFAYQFSFERASRIAIKPEGGLHGPTVRARRAQTSPATFLSPLMLFSSSQSYGLLVLVLRADLLLPRTCNGFVCRAFITPSPASSAGRRAHEIILFDIPYERTTRLCGLCDLCDGIRYL